MRRIELSEEVVRQLDWVGGCGDKRFEEAIAQFKERPDIINLRVLVPLLEGLIRRLEAFKGGHHLSVIRQPSYNRFFESASSLMASLKKEIDAQERLHESTSKESVAPFFSIVPSAPSLEAFTVSSVDYSTGAIPKKIHQEQEVAELLQQQAISCQQHDQDLRGPIDSEEMVQFLIERGYGKTRGLHAIRLKSYNKAYYDHQFGIDYKGSGYGADVRQFLQDGIASFSKQFSSEQFESYASRLQVQGTPSNFTLGLKEFINKELQSAFSIQQLSNLDQCPKKWSHKLFLVSDSYCKNEQGKVKCKLILSPNAYDQCDTIVWGRTLECKSTHQILQSCLIDGKPDQIWHRPNQCEIFASGNVFDVRYVSGSTYELIKARANQQEDLASLRDNIDHKYLLQLVVRVKPIRNVVPPLILCRGSNNISRSGIWHSYLQSDGFPHYKTFMTAKQSDYRQQANKGDLEKVDYKVISMEVVCLKFILLRHSRCNRFKDFAEGKRVIEADMKKEFFSMEEDLKSMSNLFDAPNYASGVSQKMTR